VSFEEVDNADELSSWPIASHFLCNTLHRYGLIDKNGPKMVYNHPNDDDCDILFTMWETDALPRHFIDRLGHYRHVLVGSNFNQRVFNNHHPSVHKIGLGVDPDRMNPWGGAFRFSDRKTFLSVFRDQYRKAFDVTVKAWIASGLWKDDCELVAYSPNLDHRRYMSGPGEVLRDANFVSTFDKEHKIRYLKPNRDIAFSEMSRIYRGSDFFVSSSRSEAFGLPVAEAMACGIPCIIPDYGACEEFVTPEGCISIPGRSAVADYSDKGFGDVGHWWEPDTAALSSAFKRAAALDEAECGAMGEAGRQHVLSQLTWRHAAFRFHEFSRQQLSGASRSVTAGGRGAATRRHWTRQFGRAALMLDLLRRGQLGRVLVLVGRFLQRRGH
jgi:glycosyltransferase involved in cell wall biosynthesis